MASAAPIGIELVAARQLTPRELTHMRTYPGFLLLHEPTCVSPVGNYMYTFWLKNMGVCHQLGILEHLVDFWPNRLRHAPDRWQYGELATGTLTIPPFGIAN